MQHGRLMQVAQGHQVIGTREAVGVAERRQLELDGVGQRLRGWRWSSSGAERGQPAPQRQDGSVGSGAAGGMLSAGHAWLVATTHRSPAAPRAELEAFWEVRQERAVRTSSPGSQGTQGTVSQAQPWWSGLLLRHQTGPVQAIFGPLRTLLRGPGWSGGAGVNYPQSGDV